MTEKFCDSLLNPLSGERPILFAGAGVGARAGLPDWGRFVSHLTSVASKYEKETATIMEARARAGLLADAVFYYKKCPLIPEGEKWAQLAAPFVDEKTDPDKLLQLVKLPFAAIVTTNYDRSLDNAWAAVNRKAPRTFELDDGSLKQAPFCNDFYIARIHGRATMPQSMIASSEDFASLDGNTYYRDFLLQNVLLRQKCLFVGYSFSDPAINKILKLLEDLLGPTYTKKHFALLPEGAGDLAARFARFNIQVLPYTDHKALWDCIESLPLKLVGEPKPKTGLREYPLPYEQMRVFLASCYVQSKMSKTVAPLRDLVVRGIILSLIEQEKAPRTAADVARLLAEVIPLDKQEAENVTAKALDSLAQSRWLTIVDGAAKIAKKPSRTLDDHLGTLVGGTLSRLLVREGKEAKKAYEHAVRTVLQEVVFVRGWALGADFAAVKVAGPDLYELIKKSLRRILTNESLETHARIANALYDLLRRPDEPEARILADIARLSFGLNVILKVGNTALRLEALPERIYLDATILLPAITDGHPFRPVYQSTINKISRAALETGKQCEILVISDILNEVVSHRALAIRMVRELQLEDPEKLERHVLYYGAENTNVFVGAYASWTARQKKARPFKDFLSEVAPYTTESSLATFIARSGIKTVKASTDAVAHKQNYQRTEGWLANAYREFGREGWAREKAYVLIEHEALQLALLESELEAGRSSYFVTADKTLREIVSTTRQGRSWNVVISHVGLVQLADLLLGVEAEPRSLASLMWGIVEVDEHSSLRNYFVNLALKTYDEAIVMNVPQIIEQFADLAEREAKLEGLDLISNLLNDRAKTARFLDRFENEFFQSMAKVIRRRKAQERDP